MLSPLFSNSMQIDFFRENKEDYVMLTFFFHSPQSQVKQTWRPPVDFMPVSTIIMPRKAYKDIMRKFLGHMARQDEPNPVRKET